MGCFHGSRLVLKMDGREQLVRKLPQIAEESGGMGGLERRRGVPINTYDVPGCWKKFCNLFDLMGPWAANLVLPESAQA